MCYLYSGISNQSRKIIEELGTWRKATWYKAAEAMVRLGVENIIETGCYRGTHADGASTIILAQLSKDFGGWVDSYEINPNNIRVAEQELSRRGLIKQVAFHEGDSVTSLAARTDPIQFAYLDSYDCGIGPDYSECQKHSLAELEAVLPLLARRSGVMLDDYLSEKAGKPQMAMQRLARLDWRLETKDYQVLYTTENSHRLVPHDFCILSGHLPNYAPMAAKTLYRNRAQYALRHGYDLKFCRSVLPEYMDTGSHQGGFSFSRLRMLLNLIKSGMYKWIWCVGCDTLVTNLGVKLEDLVADAQRPEALTARAVKTSVTSSLAPPAVLDWEPTEDHIDYGEKHLIICGEAVAPMQADSFLVRSSPEGQAYIEELLDLYPKYQRHEWVENQAMIDLRQKHAAITHILPQHRLNAFDYSLFHQYGEIYKTGFDCYGHRGQWQKGDFLIHWPAQSYEKRMSLIEKYEPEIVG